MTLLELLLAIGLLILLTSFMFGFYWNALAARDRGIRDMHGTQLARVIALQMAREIRSVSGTLGGYGPGLTGDEREITLTTVVLPDRTLFRRASVVSEKEIPAQSDIRQISYYLAYDPEQEFEYPDNITAAKNLGLVRREIKTLNQTSLDQSRREEVDTDLLAPELGYLRFRYFDGVDWVKKWDISGLPGQNALPQAVEVTVGYKPAPPPPGDEELGGEEAESTNGEDEEEVSDIADPEPFTRDAFTVVVRVPQSDTFFGSRVMRATKKFSRSGGGLGDSLGSFGKDKSEKSEDSGG